MPTETVLHKIEDTNVADAVNRAAAELDAAGGDLLLDFSAVRRLDSAGLRAMENLVRTAEEKAIKVALREVNAGIYKVLKLMKLAERLSFAG